MRTLAVDKSQLRVYPNRGMSSDQDSVIFIRPIRLAKRERARLYAALEQFLKLGDSPQDYRAFANQNPAFFPVPIHDRARISLKEPRSGSWVRGSYATQDAKPMWTGLIAWEPVCHKLVLEYRNILREAWRPPKRPLDIANGESFEILMGCETAHYSVLESALVPIYEAYPHAVVGKNPIMADWLTGTFVFEPDTDFRRAVYLIFRENWRARTCRRCGNPFIAEKPAQSYCSVKCLGEVRREQKLIWWDKKGNPARKERRSARPRRKSQAKRAPKRRA